MASARKTNAAALLQSLRRMTCRRRVRCASLLSRAMRRGSTADCLDTGPARTTPGYAYYDTYDLTPLLRCGENELRVEVWSYGWSTYQSLAEHGGLLFDVTQNGNVLAASGSGTRCARDTGFVSHAPKRNVNLGFAEYYDGRLFDQRWITESARTRGWPAARCFAEGKQNASAASHPRPASERSLSQACPARGGCQKGLPGLHGQHATRLLSQSHRRRRNKFQRVPRLRDPERPCADRPYQLPEPYMERDHRNLPHR